MKNLRLNFPKPSSSLSRIHRYFFAATSHRTVTTPSGLIYNLHNHNQQENLEQLEMMQKEEKKFLPNCPRILPTGEFLGLKIKPESPLKNLTECEWTY